MQSHATGSMIERILHKEGESMDLYYGEKSNVRYSKVPTIQRTNAIFNLSSVQGGSSSVYISPDAGVSTLMVALELPAPNLAAGGFQYAGCALPQSWGYNAINFVQMRIGNSSLFQWSGRQLMLQAIRTAGSQTEANDLMALAGNLLRGTKTEGGANDFLDDEKRWAYITLPMPWCGAESKDSPLPLPTDALSSPVQLIVNLKSVSEILASGTVPVPVPTSDFSWRNAFVQVKQIIPVDGHRPAKKEHYALPITFVQQENSAVVDGTSSNQEIALLGFRNGSIQELDIYCLDQALDPKLNPFLYTLPKDANIIYMGNQIHTFKGYSSQYWTTVFSDKPSRWNNFKLDAGAVVSGATAFTVTPAITSWLQVPFEGRYAELDAEELTSSSGLAVQNGILNFQLTLPRNDDASSKKFYVYYTADLQSAIVFHDGTADYAF